MKHLFAVVILSIIPSLLYAQGKPPSKATSVIVAPVKLDTLYDEIEALGTLRSQESVDLTSTVTEIVRKVGFEDGQRVKEGDVLIEMDAAEELAELAEEQSRYDEAKRQVDRLQPLVKRGAVSESELDENERDLATAKARINAIKSRISQRQIRAPFDGMMGLRNISVGDVAQTGTLLATIDADAVMKLDFTVPEVFVSSISSDMSIKARTKAYPKEVFEGVVSSLGSRIDPVSRSITVRALIDNELRKLKPGMLMYVRLLHNEREALTLPEEAVLSDGDKHRVWLVKDGKAHTQFVEIGTRKAGDVEILEGLSEGDNVVAHGTVKMRPNLAVTIQATLSEGQEIKDLIAADKNNTNPGE